MASWKTTNNCKLLYFPVYLLGITLGLAATADERDYSDNDKLSEALGISLDISDLGDREPFGRVATRKCYVAVDTLLKLSASAEGLMELARSLEHVCERGQATRLELLGLKYLIEGVDHPIGKPSAGGSFLTDTFVDPGSIQNKERLDRLRVAIQQCWNVGALSTDALSVTVTVAFNLNRDGRPDASSLRMTGASGGSPRIIQQAYETARRAIIRCGADGFSFPPEDNEEWQKVELTFDAVSMRID